MTQLPGWSIGKDNQVRSSPYELRQLRTKRYLTDRTFFIECPNYPVMDVVVAKHIAVLALSGAVIGNCGRICVRGSRWRYEFDTKMLNNSIRKRWGRRTGMVQNPEEQVAAGCFYDTIRKLWSVPNGYLGARERKVFHVKREDKKQAPVYT